MCMYQFKSYWYICILCQEWPEKVIRLLYSREGGPALDTYEFVRESYNKLTCARYWHNIVHVLWSLCITWCLCACVCVCVCVCACEISCMLVLK